MPEAYEETLSDLFMTTQLNIPLYQRSYSWEPKQVKDLLDDIDYVYERLDENEGGNSIYHYFGTIVLDNKGSLSAPGTEDWKKFDVIDGQQRLTTVSLLMSCISNELKELDKVFDDLQIEEEKLPQDIIDLPGTKSKSQKRKYVKKGRGESGRHLQLGSLTERAYQKLVLENKIPEDVLKSEDLVPAMKLARAKSTIVDWIEEKREEHIEEGKLELATEEEAIRYYESLHDIVRVVSSKFRLTVHEVPDASEAGRLFEAVNDRGRDITLSDKVRSYLIYISGEVESLDTTTVASRYNEAVETIATYAEEDSKIDQFVRYHWELFTGEYKRIRKDREPTEIHRRVKQSERHIPVDRPDDEIVRWVETYVNSLQDAADAFIESDNMDVFMDRYNGVDEDVISRMHSIHNHNAKNLTPVMMAANLRFGVNSDEFGRVIELLECYSFRCYQVMKRSRQIGRREFKEMAHRLYAEKLPDDFIENTLGGSLTDDPYGGDDEAIRELTSEIERYIGEHCPEEDFVEHLTKSDVMNGSDTRGWPGFCNSSAIRYFLYEYERHLRQGSDSAVATLPSVTSLDEDFTIEHISPVSPDLEEVRLPNHEKNVNRLGNLALLGPRDNSTASNNDYQTKYEEVYSRAMMRMLSDDLPDPREGWGIDKIDEREKRLVNFAMERWGGTTAAVVVVKNDSEVSADVWSPVSEVSREIRSDAGDAFSEKEGFNPPHMEITSTESVENDTENIHSQHCGSGHTRIEESEEGVEYYCCDEEIELPNILIRSN